MTVQILTSAQTEKVFARLGTNIRKKLKDNAPNYIKTHKRKFMNDTRNHQYEVGVTRIQLRVTSSPNVTMLHIFNWSPTIRRTLR